MFLRTSLISLLLFVTVGCGNDGNTTSPELKSKYILPADSFALLLADMAVAENSFNLNILNLKFEKYDSGYKFNPWLQNNMSKTRYDSTINVYSKYPKEYRAVYEEVLEILNRKKTQ